MGKKQKTEVATKQDHNAAMMAWYQESILKYPDGLISQAQAATILGVSRMAISRLISRGYLDAVYFPKAPDIEGIAISQDDPTWLQIIGWLGKWDKGITFPKASYVSFADVKRLWESGDSKQKCKINWSAILLGIINEKKSDGILNKDREEHRKVALEEKASNSNGE